MFLKKKPGLPKAPDVSQIKDFSLFGATARPGAESERGPQGLVARKLKDVIDVEVIEVIAPAPEATGAGGGPKGIKIKARKPGVPLDLGEGGTPHKASVEPPAESGVASASASADPAKAAWWKGLASLKGAKPAKTAKPLAEGEPATDKTGGPASLTASPDLPASAPRKFLFRARKKDVQEPTAPPVSQATKEAGGWGGRFKRATEASSDKKAGVQPVDTEQSSSGEQRANAADPKKSAGFSWGRKAAGTPAEKAAETVAGKASDKPAKKKTASRTSKNTRSDAPRGSVDLLLEMESGRKVYWRVSKQDVQELDESVVRRAVSFSRAELRLSTGEALAFGPAQDLALAELGEDVRIVNGSRALRAIYAITARRAQELEPVVSAPGLMLLDHLLQDKRVEGEPLLCALVLKGADDAARIAVLCHYTEAGELGALQVTVNPDNLNFVLSQFAASRRLNTEQTQVVLLSNAELLQAAGKIQSYPSEALWRGYSIRKLTWGTTWAAVGIATVCALYAGQSFTSLQLAQSRIGEAQAQAQEKKAKASLDALLVSSVRSFAHLQSLNLSQVTERAGEVWTPGSTVSVDAGISSQLYTTQLPLTRGVMQGNRPSVLVQTLPAHVRPLLERDPPQECTKSLPEISGALNVVQITVTCESTPGALAAYRLD